MSKKNNPVETETNEVMPPQAPPVPPMMVNLVERLADADKAALDLAKMKRELSLERAKTALAQSEAAELSYNNVVLQLAIRYHLVDGDTISENGEIQRKS